MIAYLWFPHQPRFKNSLAIGRLANSHLITFTDKIYPFVDNYFLGHIYFLVSRLSFCLFTGVGGGGSMWPLPMMPLLGHRSCRDPSCPQHTGITTPPSPSHSAFTVQGPPNMFKLTCSLCSPDFRQAGGWYSRKKPSCYRLLVKVMFEDEKALKSRNQSKLFFLTNVHSQSKPLSVML